MPRHCLRIRLQRQKRLRGALCCPNLRFVLRYKSGKATRNLLNSMESISPRRLARPRTSPFHGGNTGSNPVGDANTPKNLQEPASDSQYRTNQHDRSLAASEAPGQPPEAGAGLPGRNACNWHVRRRNKAAHNGGAALRERSLVKRIRMKRSWKKS